MGTGKYINYQEQQFELKRKTDPVIIKVSEDRNLLGI
jgi:uncharacterized beta-barrel protein YwiB (DUF1934 family)